MTEQEINLHLREIIDTMNDGLVLVRPDGSIMMINDALCSMLGYSKEELLNKPCSEMGCDECERSRAAGGKHWCKLFDTRRETHKNCHVVRKDGTYVHVLKSASLLKDDQGQILGAVETITDITPLDEKDRKINELSRRLDTPKGFHGMIGRSPAMQRVYTMLEKAAASDAPVIIHGESGTGKELAAAALHELGPRSDGPFVTVNCAALNESLLESEMFGHVKGAFTGAHRHRKGRFEEASGGGVFLDEIGDVPMSVQVKLLRVLETSTFERVGDSRPLPLDARIITATHQDIPALVEQERFRRDFFYRINTIPIHLPPLRDRREDIPLLIEHFLGLLNIDAECESTGLSSEAMNLLMAHSWPGNIRELKSALQYAFVIRDTGPIRPEHLPPELTSAGKPSVMKSIHINSGNTCNDNCNEKKRLVEALQQASGNKSEAARILGVSRGTVLNRMRKYRITLSKTVLA